MPDSAIDLLAINRGTVTAPAGCGKTHLIAETLKQHGAVKPILILTHTNAGVAALRGRLDNAGVPPRAYRLATLDGWAIRLIGMFPARSEVNPDVLKLETPRNDYPAIRKAAATMLKAGHVLDILSASYDRLIVDEYQDCSILQHAIVYYAAPALPLCVLGDPMQAIFGWQGNELADWDKHVCTHFPLAGELRTPWRWKNANTESFGRWLLDVRRALIDGTPIDLRTAPPEVSWVNLDGTENRVRQLRAASTRAPDRDGTVLIIGKSTSPPSQQEFASQTPGAVTVEAVDLKDLVQFARDLDFGRPDALTRVVSFAASVMTNIGASDLIRRVETLVRGTARRDASDVEQAALRFKAAPSPTAAVAFLSEISKQGGVRTHRPAVLRAGIKALQSCDGSEGNSFYEAVLRSREQNRLLGRPLPKRAVGSTLLLKGLEADVSIILDASDLDARNLYVAMTRGSKRLVVCSDTPILTRGA
jgi:DNA helicase-2/ATP-dependent DNA helicase PcrA